MSSAATSSKPDEDVAAWASQIASKANLGDPRLELRLALILKAFADRPLDAIPQANGGDAHQAKATYRFFANARFDYKDLVEGISAATVANCADQETIYAVQDSTSLNFTNLKRTTGLGFLNDSQRARGLHVHSTIAVDPQGIVRGPVDVDIWARLKTNQAADRKERPVEAKESFKWLKGMRAARAAWAELPDGERPHLVHVMDREGDIHEVFEEIAEGEGLLVRCAQNRTIAGLPNKAQDAVAQSPCLGVLPLSVPVRDGQPQRDAQLEIRASTVTLAPNKSGRQPVDLTLIEARERDAPAGSNPILWRLWTNEPADALELCVALVRAYALRWRVEEYHLALKSGCTVEKLALETTERLCKAVVVYAAIATRIVALRDLGRRSPGAPCTDVLSDIEWQVLVRHFERRLPARDEAPPSILQAMRWIGRLGGHLGRKSDGLPGVRTLWRGWRDLALMVAGFRAAACDR